MFVTAHYANRISTSEVARAMFIFGQAVLSTLSNYAPVLPTNLGLTITLAREFREEFLRELRNAGYTVYVLSETEEDMSIIADWAKPKVFNSKMEV